MNIQPQHDEVDDDVDECIVLALADAIFHLNHQDLENPRQRELRLMEADLVRLRLRSHGFAILKASQPEQIASAREAVTQRNC